MRGSDGGLDGGVACEGCCMSMLASERLFFERCMVCVFLSRVNLLEGVPY